MDVVNCVECECGKLIEPVAQEYADAELSVYCQCDNCGREWLRIYTYNREEEV